MTRVGSGDRGKGQGRRARVRMEIRADERVGKVTKGKEEGQG